MKNAKQRDLGMQIENHENLYFKERRILCRDGDVGPVRRKGGYDGRWWEWQANRAIGGFLLPASLVRQASAPFTESSPVTQTLSLPTSKRQEAERELARIFAVNPVVARIRLQEMFPLNAAQMEF